MKGGKAAGAIALFCAALVWGLSFPAQSVASDVVGSFTFIAGKSSVAFLFALAMIAARVSMRKKQVRTATGSAATTGSATATGPAATGSAAEPAATGLAAAGPAATGTAAEPVTGSSLAQADLPTVTQSPATFLPTNRAVVVGGIVCGLVLFAADNCQQAGIGMYPPEAAASGRAGFLTATYVVMVAVLARFMGKRLRPAVVAAVAVCLVGMYLLCVPPDQGFSGVYTGDVVMLAGALFYSFHILAVGRYSLYDALWLSAVQFLTSAVLSSVCAFALEGATPLDALPALLPILYVGVFSTGLGYTLQNIGQRTVDEAPAAILMSLESVFAALGGWVLLHEQLSATELAGCALVFAAVLLAQLPQFKRERSR